MWLNPTEPSRSRLAVLIAVLAILPYVNSLPGEFTLDDVEVVRDNPTVSGQAASPRLLYATAYNPDAEVLVPTMTPIGAYWVKYRPVTMLTYWLNARLGESAIGYHLVNLGLHALVAIAMFYLAYDLLGSASGATISAALFAVHPIHTEAVSSIVGRAELLAALAVLVSLLAMVRATTEVEHRTRWLTLSAGALVIGCLAKESAFVGIPLCLAAHLWVRRTSALRESLMLMLPGVFVGVAYLGLRALAIGRLTVPATVIVLDNPLAQVPLAPRLETALAILWQYLAQLTVPLRLSADYSYNEIPVVASARDPRFVGAAVLFTGLAIGLMLSRKRAPALALAAAFFAIPLLLTANVLFPIGTIKAERLLYLPSFGWCLGCAGLIMQIPERQRGRCLTVVALVVVAFAGRTWVRNWDWQNNFALFSATVQTSAHSAKAHHNLAVAYTERGDLDNAMLQFHESLAIYPPYDDAAFGIGKIYERKGIDAGALEWYATATRLNPNWAPAHLNSGAIYYKRGEFTAAEKAFRAGLESQPNNPRLLIGLALVRLAQDDRAEAEILIGRATSLADGDHEVAALLAEARQAFGQKVTR